ncbi:MAG: hypothetical protein ACPGLV_02155 [Bacteroidia bacterium]
MQDRNLQNEQESLAIISSMINQAKGNIGSNSIHYLLWGWLGVVCSVSQFIMIKQEIELHFIPWVILMPLGGIVAAIIAKRARKQHANIGYMDKVMGYLWGSFAFSVIIIMANGFAIGWNIAYAMLILLIGLATYVSGSVLKFTPLKIGGWFAWALTAVAIYTSLEISVICIALTMLVSYLIPGYILKAKHGQKA